MSRRPVCRRDATVPFQLQADLSLTRTGPVRWRPAHAAYAMRCVEFNPVRAGMVESVLDYQWSSARAHCGLDAAPAQLNLSGWQLRYSAQQWAEVLGLGFRHSGDLDRLRQATRTGRPFGTPDFVTELEERLERTLHPRKRGRKPKSELNTKRPIIKTAGNS